MPTKWEKVYIFISSTFNDMHAERDYLIKQVFPQLYEWCERRKLRLVDIDLRWGVTEQDALYNKNVVKVCLDRIDDCRPFFISFLGQRRGWVPTKDDISKSTYETFPELESFAGKSSVSELEILHALVNPLHKGKQHDPEKTEESYDPVKYAFFYLRDKDYINELPKVPPLLLQTYTNEGITDTAERKASDAETEQWRNIVIPNTGRPVHHYQAKWNTGLQTPELAIPLQCPSSEDISIKRWRTQWEEAGIRINGTEIAPGQINEAKEFNRQLTVGRLTDFRAGGKVLSEIIISEFQEAIAARYADHAETKTLNELQKEIDQQEQFLESSGEAFIEREHDFDDLLAYLKSDDTRPLLLTSKAGMGKTSLLARFILTSGYKVIYRFIGKSDEADSSDRLALSILNELSTEGRIVSAIPRDPETLQRTFPQLIAEAVSNQQLILIIDALDQLTDGCSSLEFMLRDIPNGLKLIASIKIEGSEDFIERYANSVIISKVRPFDSLEDRRQLVNAYLGNYLKQLDEDKLDALISVEGAANPLFLKTALQELRVFGVNSDLKKVIENRFGKTPESAFNAVLSRLESDPAYSGVPMKALTENVFGWLGHVQSGLSISELSEMLVSLHVSSNLTEACDAVNALFRQLRPDLAIRDGRTDFYYESFREACIARYEKIKPAEKWHGELARFFAGKSISDKRRLYEQAFQYSRAGMTEDFMDFVFNADYVENKLMVFGTEALARDYTYHSCVSTNLMLSFYRMCSAILKTNPDQLANQLFGHLSGIEDKHCRKLLDETAHRKKALGEAWLMPKAACFDKPSCGIVREFHADFELGAAVKLISNDTRMVAQSGSHEIAVWDVENGDIVKRIGTGKLYINTIESSPDGKSFAVILRKDNDMLLRVWDAFTFRVRCDIPIHEYWLGTERSGITYNAENSFTFTFDSRTIIIKDSSDKIRLFDAESGEFLSATDYSSEINSYGIGKDGLIIAGNLHQQRNDGSWELSWFKRDLNSLSLFDYDLATRSLKKRDTKLAGHKNNVVAVAASPDNSMVVSADEGGCVCLWDVANGKTLHVFSDDGYKLTHLSFLSGGKLFLAVGRIGNITIYDTKNFAVKRRWTGLGVITGADLFRDESACVIIIGLNSIRIIDLGSDDTPQNSVSEPIRNIGILKERGLIVASSYKNYIDPNWQPIVSDTANGALHFFDLRSGMPTGRVRLHCANNLDFVYVDPNGHFVVSKYFSVDPTPVFNHWDLGTGLTEAGEEPAEETFRMAEVKTSTYSFFPNEFRFSSDLRYMCGHGHDINCNAVHIYKTSTGRYIGKVLLKSADKMNKKYFYAREFETTPDGAVLYVLYPEAGLLEAYELARKKQLLSKKLSGYIIPDIFSSDFNNDGLSLSKDGTHLLFVNEASVMLIDIARGRVEFSLDRKTHKPGKLSRDIDTFTSMSGNARYLALVRSLYGEGVFKDEEGADDNRNFTRTDRFEVWDMRKDKKIAEFYTGGKISNILADDTGRTFTFGLWNGRICVLELENYI